MMLDVLAGSSSLADQTDDLISKQVNIPDQPHLTDTSWIHNSKTLISVFEQGLIELSTLMARLRF